MPLNRSMFRGLLAGGLAALAFCAQAADGAWVHAWASFGEPLHAKDFKHFNYVNPQAPKRGTLYLENPDRRSSFDKLNPFTLKGEWPAGLLIWMMEPLAVRGADEPQTMYGLLAQEIKVAPDRSAVWFRLNPAAKFSNGDAVTAADVKISFEAIRGAKAHPNWQTNLSGVKAAVVEDERTIRFDLNERDPDTLFKVGALMPVFSAKWLLGKDGKARALDEVVTDIPLSSGPYLVEAQDNGRGITFVRRKDYWGEALAVRRGFFNFDRVVYRYYKDREVATEAFKAGETDLARVYGARLFARQHKGRKWEDGRIIKRSFVSGNVEGLQSYQLNLRLPKFQDIRVRQALGLTWDFDASNIYKTFHPADSVFNNSEYAAQGLPSKEERALLEPFRAQLPQEVFGPPYKAPRSHNDPLQMRANLLKARELFAQAGWKLAPDGKLRNAKGEAFEFEYLSAEAPSSREIEWASVLKKLGVTLTVRQVDYALFGRRLEEYDFDTSTIVEGHFPIPPVQDYLRIYHSKSAATKGNDNYRGVSHPAVDAMLKAMGEAKTNAELVTASRALDRIVMWHYWQVPQLYSNSLNVSYWNKFGLPDKQPKYFQIQVAPDLDQQIPWPLITWWIK
jgi:microcin C transport system substrate-binding protein